MPIEESYRKYAKDIYRFIFSIIHDHYLSEDLVQETFLRAYMQNEAIRSDKIKPWLFTVAYNICIDHLRKKKTFFIANNILDTIPSSCNIEEDILKEEQHKSMLLLTNKLPNSQRQAILLHYMHGYSYKEASILMDMSLANFKTTLYRARKSLQNSQSHITAKPQKLII